MTRTTSRLAYREINENGTLPYEFDGEIPIIDARTRIKRRK